MKLLLSFSFHKTFNFFLLFLLVDYCTEIFVTAYRMAAFSAWNVVIFVWFTLQIRFSLDSTILYARFVFWWISNPRTSWQLLKIFSFLLLALSVLLYSSFKEISHFFDSTICVIETLFNHLVFSCGWYGYIDDVHDFIFR